MYTRVCTFLFQFRMSVKGKKLKKWHYRSEGIRVGFATPGTC